MPQLHLGSSKKPQNTSTSLITVGTQSMIERRRPHHHSYQKLLAQRGKRSGQRPGKDTKDQPSQQYASAYAQASARSQSKPGEKSIQDPAAGTQDVTVLSSYAAPAESPIRVPDQHWQTQDAAPADLKIQIAPQRQSQGGQTNGTQP